MSEISTTKELKNEELNPNGEHSKKSKASLKIKDITLIAMFSALMAICSWISIPMIVPFTLQTFAVFLAMIVLGGFKGIMSILVYILLGIIGAPVFANFNGGIAYLLGPTGGYIVGFLFSGLIMWALEKPLTNKGDWQNVLVMFIGLFVCYLIGTIWFKVVYVNKDNDMSILQILAMCVFPFIIPDTIKIVLALFIQQRLKRITNNN